MARKLLYAIPLSLFGGLIALSEVFFWGERERQRLLIEYEAERIASSLLEMFQESRTVESSIPLPETVLGFGIYQPSGAPVFTVGDAPPALPLGNMTQSSPVFTYDSRSRTLTLVRPLGMGAGRMRGGRMMKNRGQSGIGYLYQKSDINAFAAQQTLAAAAGVAIPLALMGTGAIFLLLLRRNAQCHARAESQERLARLGEAARTLSHEIKNPLGVMQVRTGYLKKVLPAEHKADIEAIEEEIQRISTLTSRIGDFLRDPHGQPQEIDVGRFLADTASKLAFPVTVRDDGTSLRIVRFDSERLRSVLENLLRNSHESYMGGASTGGGEVEVRITTGKGAVTVSVLDRGRGIAKDVQDRIFDPFFTDKPQGSGVGLALFKRFVEAAGGKLEVAPREGGGTEARMTLAVIRGGP